MQSNFTDVYLVQNISIFPVYLGILLWQVIIAMKYNIAPETYLCINTEVDSSNYDILGPSELIRDDSITADDRIVHARIGHLRITNQSAFYSLGCSCIRFQFNF